MLLLLLLLLLALWLSHSNPGGSNDGIDECAPA
jgi:hypothetical protein